jgi:hypothetical protein
VVVIQHFLVAVDSTIQQKKCLQSPSSVGRSGKSIVSGCIMCANSEASPSQRVRKKYSVEGRPFQEVEKFPSPWLLPLTFLVHVVH